MVSQDIVKHLTAEEITMVYSGDDHDYCEIEHNEFTGRIREITVKSMSWAMGIRVPGVQLASLWNPVDLDRLYRPTDDGAALATPRDTVQNHLCLLPNQLSVFIRYAQVLGVTILALSVHAIRYKPGAMSEYHRDKSEPLLPITRERDNGHGNSNTSQTCSSVRKDDENLSTRKMGGCGYGNIPASSRTPSPSKPRQSDDDDERWRMFRAKYAASRPKIPRSRLEYFARSMWQVAWPVLLVYFWLICKG